MSTADAFWMSIGASGRLVELSRDDCLELLGAMSVGRIAYTTDDGPRVLPVNYVLEGDSVVFRTVPDGEVYRHALGTTCAFEIDEIDEFYQSGWSVLAVGGLRLLTEEGFARLQFGRIPKPWAAGPGSMFVRLPCVQLTGRRVIPDGR
jgi:hypothetical protein